MGVPGSSAVYFGGTVAYNTRKSQKLLCGDDELYKRLLDPVTNEDDEKLLDEHPDLSAAARKYIKSKLHWTRETAMKYCHHVETNYAIAEGGATGPTFRPEGLATGFAVLAVAGRKSSGEIGILAQTIVRSTHANREENMRLFADSAAKLCIETLANTKPYLDASGNNAINSLDDSPGINEREACLDRSSHLRNDAEAMKEFYEDPNALHVIIRGGDEVMFASSTELALPTLSNIIANGNIGVDALNRRTFLGRLGSAQTPVFGVYLPKDTSYTDQNTYFAVTRSNAPLLGPLHNELVLTATAYANWQKSHQYCYICGSPLEYIHGGTVSCAAHNLSCTLSFSAHCDIFHAFLCFITKCAKCINADGKHHLHWPRYPELFL
jgi:nicotinamide mononucleotide (NMN) deamidase PncC